MNTPVRYVSEITDPAYNVEIIQGSFGYAHATTPAQIGFLSNNFVWRAGNGQHFTYTFIIVNQITTFWTMYRGSLDEYNMIYRQWQGWMPPFQHPEYGGY